MKIQLGDDKYILAKALVESVFKDEEYSVIEEYIGTDLCGMHYVPLFDYAKPEGDAYRVVADNYVTMEDGTGIVHIAPAFGEDDSRVGKDNDLPFVNLVNTQGKFVDGMGDLTGMFVKDADKLIIRMLKDSGLLLSVIPFEHSYPFCWRCDTPLLYYACDTWFIKMTEGSRQPA